MTRTARLGCTIALTLIASPLLAGQTGTAGTLTMPATDLQAAQVLAQNVRADIDWAQKALAHSSDDRVKALANAVVTGQQHHLDALDVLERQFGGGPTSTPKTAPAEQQDPGPLENAIGAEFDRMFLERLARQLTDTQTIARRIGESGLGAQVKDAAKKISGEIDGELKQVTALRGGDQRP